MKNSLLRGTLKWGATYASIIFAMTLLLPMRSILDTQMIIFFSLVVGFIVGVALYILNLVASEAVRFIEYQLTKVKGVTWSNHSAVLRVRSMTAYGRRGACFLLLFYICLVFTDPTVFKADLAVFWIGTGAVVMGSVLGVITYFFFWGVFPILGYIRTGAEYFRVPVIRVFRALMQLYQKWKRHDYRS